MNILYHHRTLADGAEGIHIHEMVEAFRALGHTVMIQAMARPAGEGQGDRGVLAALRRRLPQGLFEFAALTLNSSDYLVTRRKLSAGTVDLVYKRHALLDVGAPFAARSGGVPLVLEVNTAYSAPSVREFEPVRLLGLTRRAERLALRAATLVVAVSSPLADYLRELAGVGLPVITLPNGVNQRLFDPVRVDGAAVRARYGLADRFVIGWAGVLRRWHGIEVLIEALADVPSAHLLLIGDGPDRPLIEQLARERGLTGRLTVTGRVPHNAMPSYLAAVDVAVAAGDRTGFASPMKIIEYMSMARPVVLPRLRNFEDIVQHDVSGLFSRPDDPRDLARTITALQESPALRNRLGSAAAAEVKRRLNWKCNAEAVLNAVALRKPASRP